MHAWGVSAGAGPVILGGTPPAGLSRRWPGVAVACAAAALLGCSTLHESRGEAARAEFAHRMASGHRLYQEGEFALAASRFGEAAQLAHAHRVLEPEKRATVAECVSWLRSRAIPEFDACTQRLDDLHQRAKRSERGIGTLLALGALAGDREPPRFRIPADVGPVLRKAARSGGEE